MWCGLADPGRTSSEADFFDVGKTGVFIIDRRAEQVYLLGQGSQQPLNEDLQIVRETLQKKSTALGL